MKGVEQGLSDSLAQVLESWAEGHHRVLRDISEAIFQIGDDRPQDAVKTLEELRQFVMVRWHFHE